MLQLLAAGASNQEIATALVVAPGTVKLHVSHILSKLGVHSRTRAILRARELGLLPDEHTVSSSARTCAIIEAENRRGCTGSPGNAPYNLRQVWTRLERIQRTLVYLMLPGEVSVHQLTCHFTSLHNISLRWVTQNGNRS